MARGPQIRSKIQSVKDDYDNFHAGTSPLYKKVRVNLSSQGISMDSTI